MKKKFLSFLVIALLLVPCLVSARKATETRTATIASAANLSDAIRIEDIQNLAIQMPASWTSASLTFRAAIP